MTAALFAFLHFVAVFGVFATVFLEWQTMSPQPTYAEARRLQRCDRWYGLSAMAVLVVGALRVPEPEYRRIMSLLRVQMLLLLGVALCASLMARGVGL